MMMSRRVRDITNEKISGHHDVPRPEFLFSSLCKHEELTSKSKGELFCVICEFDWQYYLKLLAAL